jgi:two-component system heavy metal sensor histidine kinase CusS
MTTQSSFRARIDAFRHSMTVQISVSIALISASLILAGGYLIEYQFVRQLRESNELVLITRLAFIRDDLLAKGFDFARDGTALAELNERRVQRLHVAFFDDRRQLITHSNDFPTQGMQLPPNAVSAEDLSNDMTAMPLDQVRERHGDATSIWVSPDRRRYRVLLGQVNVPVEAAPPRVIFVALAIETLQSTMLRQLSRDDLLPILIVALIVSVVVGIWIARWIVFGAKRLGTAAARIGSAQALDARLPLEGTPTELVESTLAFNRMLERLQLSFERLSAFSSDLAHDLRTPINNLLVEAQVALSRTRSADEYRVVIESAVEEYERMSRMIGNMLFLARADNARAFVAHESIDLRGSLERVRSYFEQVAEERHVAIAVDVESLQLDARVWADETMLIRAMGNLVSNALRHATEGSRVDLTARLDANGTCVIAVSNEGSPIAPDIKARIFDRFFRGDQAREQSSSSSGLGLAIVRSIMDLHRGSVSVESGVGQRTIFTLAFPPPGPSSPTRAADHGMKGARVHEESRSDA